MDLTQNELKIVEIKSNDDGNDDPNRIYVRNEETALQLFKDRPIYRLKVNFIESSGFGQATLDSMSKSVNLHCSDTLKEISIHDKNSFLEQVTKPFKNVERVELAGQCRRLSSDSLKFNQIFPAMTSLSLVAPNIKFGDQIYHHFPNLIDLQMKLHDWYHEILDQSDVKDILKLNPQIRSMKLSDVKASILRNVNEALPDLEYLAVRNALPCDRFHIEFDPPITFKNVNTLEIMLARYPPWMGYFFKGVKFEKLEEIKAIFASESDFERWTEPEVEFEWWYNLVDQNAHTLKQFNAIKGCIYNFDVMKFTKIPELKLTEISFAVCDGVSVGDVLKFLNENQKVKKFHIKFVGSYRGKDEKRVPELSEKLSNEWKITKSAADTIDIETQ